MKLLSIEIGYSRTILCEVDDQTRRATKMCVLPTPENVLDDGMLRETGAFAENIKEALSENGIKTKAVIFNVTSNRIATRDIEIPFVKRSMLNDVIKTNLSGYFPMDLTGYSIAYSVLEVLRNQAEEEQKPDEEEETELDRRKKKKKKKKAKNKKEKEKSAPTGYRLTLLAIPKEMTDAYRAFALQCGLEFKYIDHASNSLYQGVRKECDEDVQAVIKINERRTQVLVLKEGNAVMSRAVPYGIDEAVAVVYESGLVAQNADYDQAIEFLQTSHSFREDILDAAFGDLITGVYKVLDLYESQPANAPIKRVVLMGLGGTINVFRNYLSAQLGTGVDILTDIKGFHVPRDVRTNDLGEYVSCLGAVVSPSRFLQEEKKEKTAFGVRIDDISQIATVILVLLGIALIVTGVVGFYTEQAKNNTLRNRLRNYTPALSSYQEYTLAKQAGEYMEEALQITGLPTASLAAFIDELERTMPSDLVVTSFIADSEKVTLSVVVNDKEEAADAVMRLREFESMEQVSVSGITDTDSSYGNGGVTFTMVGIYRTAEEEEEAYVADDAQMTEDVNALIE